MSGKRWIEQEKHQLNDFDAIMMSMLSTLSAVRKKGREEDMEEDGGLCTPSGRVKRAPSFT